jgi:hypothetical protein
MLIRNMVASSFVLVLFAPAAGAGWLGDVLLRTATGLGDRAVRESSEKGYERAKESLSRRGEPGREGERRPGAALETTAAVADRSVPSALPAGKGGVPPKKGIDLADVASRYDFVPGDRVIFFDDFLGTEVGEFPRRWVLKGPDQNSWKAPLEVARYDGRHWARYRPSNDRKDVVSSFYVRLNPGKDMPERFTVEFDAVLPPFDGTDQRPQYRVLMINHGREYQGHDYGSTRSNVVRIGSIGAGSGNTRLDFERGDGQIHRVAISVNGSSVKAYLDQELVVNDPEGIVRPVTVIGMELAYQTGAKILPLMFTNFRVAAGGNDTPEGQATNHQVESVKSP